MTARSARPVPADLSALDATLARIDNEVTWGVDKGLPEGPVRLGDIAQQGWNLLQGDLPMPNLVLKQSALTHNTAHMQAYCDQNGAWFSPHGKTTMAPKIFRDQLKAGAWAITVANIAQLQVCLSFGIERVYVANEMVTDYDARFLARQLVQRPSSEIYVAVDSKAGVDALAAAVKASGGVRRQRVLVDFGMPGGRCGVRTVEDAVALAHLILAEASALELVGVHGYEGIAHGTTREAKLATANAYLADLQRVARAVGALCPDAAPFLVTAGGSEYFDRVVDLLGAKALGGCQLVLRSGGYVTHDSSFYDKISPFGSRTWRPALGARLIPAIEVWSAVLSLPEPGLAILGMGGRDMPTDIELPVPLFHARKGAPPSPLDGAWRITRSNDQHAYLSFAGGPDLAVGDLIGSGISHPCTAFDKWRSILVVDEEYQVVDYVRTYF
ncbi:MAG: alanine racemase [Rhodobacter sp.]|jgi:D-serine dehydratase|nr:alanine racemase [Rhodobacter sp.]